MLPDMSSDRISAYRVFKGEIEKLEFLKKLPVDNTKPDHLSGEEAIVIGYLKKRMKELEKKGHDYAPRSRNDV